LPNCNNKTHCCTVADMYTKHALINATNITAIFFQSSSIRHDTIGTELRTTSRDRNKGSFAIFLKKIGVMRDDPHIFIGHFSIIFQVIAKRFHDKRKHPHIIYPEKQLHIRKRLLHLCEKRVESMIDIEQFCSSILLLQSEFFQYYFQLLVIIKSFLSYDQRCFCLHGSNKISQLILLTLRSFHLFQIEIVLYHTSRKPNLGRILKFSQFFNLSPHFILALLSHTTSIDNHNICFFHRLDILSSSIIQYCLYPRSITIIHLTSIDYYMIFHKLHFYQGLSPGTLG